MSQPGDRRRFIKSLVALFAMPWRHLLAGEYERPGYTRLKRMITIPADQVNAPWSTVTFTAVLDDPGKDQAEKILKGILLRTDQRAGKNLHAFCIYCPHEVCMVELKHDTSRVKFDRPPNADHPMFVCPCHFSVFDPLQQGGSISGPAYRGLYRFHVKERRDSVQVLGVEEEVLALYD